MASPDLGPEDINYFNTTRRRVRDTYQLGQAQNNFQRDTLASQFGRQKNDVFRQFSQMREKLPYGYASRGLLNSGIYQRGLADYAQNRNQTIGNMTAQYGEQMGALDLAQRQLGAVQTSSFQDVDTQEAARKAAAEMLRAIR